MLARERAHDVQEYQFQSRTAKKMSQMIKQIAITYNIYVCSCISYGKVFTVMREAECIDCVPGQVRKERGNKISDTDTYSQDVIVRAQIHSERSNMLTIESYPPEARYLLFYDYWTDIDT